MQETSRSTTDPRPGQGVVFVNWLDAASDHWLASWQDGPAEQSVSGTREEVLSWARSRGALRVEVFDSGTDGWTIDRV